MSVDHSEKQWKEVWELFDLDKDGKVNKADFAAAVRVCGRRYTNEQMADKMKNFGDSISYDTYFGFLCDPYTGPTIKDLKNALRAFDGKDSGELTTVQIQSLLTTMGDKIPLETVRPVLDAMPQTHGKVPLDELAEFLTPPIPSTTPNVPELMKELMREEAAKAGLALYSAPPKESREAERAPAAMAAPTLETDVAIPDAELVESGSGSESDN